MKLFSCIIVVCLLFTGFSVIGNELTSDSYSQKIKICFLEPSEIQNGDYISLDIEGANSHTYQSEKPIIPFYKDTIKLPFGIKNIDVEWNPGKIKKMTLTKKISPAPKPVIYGININVKNNKILGDIYESSELYPDSWFTYYLGAGLDEENQRKTFFTIRVNPIRYNPSEDEIYYIENFDLSITYEKPNKPFLPEKSDYDLVIISPSIFSDELDELVEHKNNYGMKTILKTTEEIYMEYSGVDKPEQIKYFIKDALDNWNIKYVLLVGGMKSLILGKSRDDDNQGTQDWHLPVRYTNHRGTEGSFDPGFISDLYFADIYDAAGKFSSWDSNGDGVFAYWKENSLSGRDIIDLYPDVYVGRLACRNNYEVKIMVNKIINYEKQSFDPSWYNRLIVLAGDSHNDTDNLDFIEGELTCDKILSSYMTEFDPIKLYASYKSTDPLYTPEPINFLREMEVGCGHLIFDGHAKPNSWSTHWLFRSGGGWTEDITIYDFPNLNNIYKLPVCIVGGCHTNQINVTLLATLLEAPKMWSFGEPTPECFGWWLTRKIGGGSIATIGNTGLGIGWVGGETDLNGDGIVEPVCLEGLGGYQQILFYESYEQDDIKILGHAWGGAQTKYLEAFPGMDEFVDAKTVEQWMLLGDPSLKIGGYS
ncbi:MAG: hypothetical protein JSV67_05110 [Thermoplasmatales archaeon]|nr:MAG: hypothetical protein JSV67_05110 [Thermoplasmatales archaeon]